MSRSYKKHAFDYFCGGSNHKWLSEMHRAYRAKEREILYQIQMNPDEDFVFPEFKDEFSNVWASPRDGHAYPIAWNFEHYFLKQIDNYKEKCCQPWRFSSLWWKYKDEPTKEEVWKDWKKRIGK